MSEEEQSESSTKDRLTTSLGKLGDKAKETAKSGVQKVGEKTKELTEKGIQKIEEKAQEAIANSLTVENSKSNNLQNERNSGSRLAQFEDNVGHTGRNIENQVQTWVGWFWSTIAYIFIIMISFVISSANGKFALLPILLLIGFPFFLYYAIVSSIPEIRIGNKVLFSRRDLSFRNQLTFTARVARAFSREMIENSPVGAFFIYSFLLLLIIILVLPFITKM